MKKIGSILITLLLLFFMMPIGKIQAADFSTSISGPSTISAGQTFTVELKASSSSSLYGVEASFSYDSNKLEIVSSAGKNGYTLTLGSKVVVDAASPKSGTFTFATVTFKAKSAFSVGSSTTISLSGVIGSDGAATLSGSGSSKKVSIPVPKSSDNYLASLSVSPKGISFNKNTTSYTVVVDNSVTSATIRASAQDSKATVSGTGTKTLKVYDNRYSIVVTAENGSKRTYTVNIVRRDEDGNAGELSKNNNLKALEAAGFSLEFQADIVEYTLEVDNLVTEIEVTAGADDENATVKINNPTPYVVGENLVEIIVTSQSGDNKTYTIRINRSGAAPTVSMSQLSEAFENATTDEIAVLADESGVLSAEVLAQLKASGKTLVVICQDENGDPLYEWILAGTRMVDGETVDTSISFVSENSRAIDLASNFASGYHLSFADSESLPYGTQVRIYTGEDYQEGDVLHLYYYNEETGDLEIVWDWLVVEDGAIVFTLDHTSDYLLTPSNIILETKVETAEVDWFMYISLLELLAIGVLIVALVISRKQLR